MSFSHEPVAYLTVLAIVIQIAIGIITKNLDTTLVTSLVTAVGGIVARSQVSPVAKVSGAL